MNRSIVSAAAGLTLSASALRTPVAQQNDPVVTDGDKYHVVLENERLRVLRYHDEPGAKTHVHHHPEFLLVALAPFTRRLTFPDGTEGRRKFSTGEVAWMKAQTHVGENIGGTSTECLLIELKPANTTR